MNDEQIKVLQNLVDQTKAQLDAYSAVLNVAQNDWKSDTDPLNAKIADLEAKLAAAQSALQ